MFCSHCGGQIPEGSAFCPNCGAPVGGNQNNYDNAGRDGFGGGMYSDVTDAEKSMALGNITKKMKNSATLWTVIGWIEIVLGIISLVLTFASMGFDELLELRMLDYIIDVVSSILLIVVAIYNLGIAKRNREFVRSVEEKPVGIVEFFEKMNIVAPILLNFFFGGLITVIPAFLDSTYKKEALSFQNRKIFAAIEYDYNQTSYTF